MTLLLTVAAIVLPGGCHTDACVARVERKACARGSVPACISRAAARWHVSEPYMRAIAWCESRFQAGAVEPSGHYGVFQFDRPTFAASPYGRHWIFSPRWNSLAAAWYLARGEASRWACA